MPAGVREVSEQVSVAEVPHLSRVTTDRGCMLAMARHDLMLDPFWVGRRGDAFDQTCR